MEKLLDFLAQLEQRKIHFTLAWFRPYTIMVMISVPGERWEVEFYADGTVEVEVFRSRAGVEGEEILAEFFERHSD